MWKSLAVFTLVFSSMVTASEEQCYFNGTVDFDTSEADYAVIRISNHNGAVDSLYLYAPDDYLFGDYTVARVNDSEPWRVDCWLILDGETVPLPQFAAGLVWPDDFRYDQSHYCTNCFQW